MKRFNKYHSSKQSDITIVTHLTNHPTFDCIIESPSLSIAKYKFKNSPNENKSFFLGNAGIAPLTKKVVTLKRGYTISKISIIFLQRYCYKFLADGVVAIKCP